MWNVVGAPIAHDWIDFEPIDTLYYFDFPMIFTCKDVAGNLYLAYNCDCDSNGLRFLVVPCDDSLVVSLVNGKINLRDALCKNRAWIFDLNKKWESVSAWSVDVYELPNDALPRPGTMLYSGLPSIVVQNKSRPCTSDTVKNIAWSKSVGQKVGIHANG